MLAGGMALVAEVAGGRRLVVFWGRDQHLDASLGELFDFSSSSSTHPPPPFSFIDTLYPPSLLPPSSVQLFDCMASSNPRAKHMRISGFSADKLIVIKSAWPLQHPKGDFKSSFFHLRSLPLHPAVGALIVDTPPKYGVHVRSVVDDAAISSSASASLTPPTPSSSLFSASRSLVAYQGVPVAHKTLLNRSFSSWPSFVPAMKEILAGDPEATFYVSADNAAAYEGFRTTFPVDAIVLIERESMTDATRQTVDVQHALADLINLGSTTVILGSAGSSFTEVAAGFGRKEGKKTVVKKVGGDFGRSFCGAVDAVAVDGLEHSESPVEQLRATSLASLSSRSEEVAFDLAEYDAYKLRVTEAIERDVLKGQGWPTHPDGRGRTDGYVYGRMMEENPQSSRSVYLPLPWHHASHHSSSTLLSIASFWNDVFDKRFPHYTVMSGVTAAFVDAKLKEIGGGEGLDYDSVVVFGDQGNKAGQFEFPIPNIVGGDELVEAPAVPTDGTAVAVAAAGDCSHVLRCVLPAVLFSSPTVTVTAPPCSPSTPLSFSKAAYAASSVALVPTAALPHGPDLSAAVQTGAALMVVYDSTTALDCPGSCNGVVVDDCGRSEGTPGEGGGEEERTRLAQRLARESVESYGRWVEEGGKEGGTKTPRVPNGLEVLHKAKAGPNRGKKWSKSPAAVSSSSVSPETGDWTYSFADTGNQRFSSKEIRPLPRVGGGHAGDVRRLWLPYRDIGVRYDRMGWIVKDSEMVAAVEGLTAEAVREKREYVAHVRELWTHLGAYEYILHKVSVSSGFTVLATRDYCDALARRPDEKGAGGGGGWWEGVEGIGEQRWS